MTSNTGDGPTGVEEKSEKVQHRKASEASDASGTELENRVSRENMLDEEEKKRLEASAKLENPLGGLTPEQLSQRGADFCAKHGITDEADIRAFRLGAMIAGNMNKYDTIDGLTDREREVLDREITHKWSNPPMLYAVIVICSLCAAVQGMDETVVNGAQSFYKVQFSIGDPESQRGKLSLVPHNQNDLHANSFPNRFMAVRCCQR